MAHSITLNNGVSMPCLGYEEPLAKAGRPLPTT